MIRPKETDVALADEEHKNGEAIQKLEELTKREEEEVDHETSDAVRSMIKDFKTYKSGEDAFHRQSIRQSDQRTDALLNVMMHEHKPGNFSKQSVKASLVNTAWKALGKGIAEKIEVYKAKFQAVQKQVEECNKVLQRSVTTLTMNGNGDNRKDLIKKLQNLWLGVYKTKRVAKCIEKLERIQSVKHKKGLKKMG